MKIYITVEYFGNGIVRIIKLSKYDQSYYIAQTTKKKFVEITNGKDRLLTHISNYHNFGENNKFNNRYTKWTNKVVK